MPEKTTKLLISSKASLYIGYFLMVFNYALSTLLLLMQSEQSVYCKYIIFFKYKSSLYAIFIWILSNLILNYFYELLRFKIKNYKDLKWYGLGTLVGILSFETILMNWVQLVHPTMSKSLAFSMYLVSKFTHNFYAYYYQLVIPKLVQWLLNEYSKLSNEKNEVNLEKSVSLFKEVVYLTNLLKVAFLIFCCYYDSGTYFYNYVKALKSVSLLLVSVRFRIFSLYLLVFSSVYLFNLADTLAIEGPLDKNSNMSLEEAYGSCKNLLLNSEPETKKFSYYFFVINYLSQIFYVHLILDEFKRRTAISSRGNILMATVLWKHVYSNVLVLLYSSLLELYEQWVVRKGYLEKKKLWSYMGYIYVLGLPLSYGGYLVGFWGPNYLDVIFRVLNFSIKVIYIKALLKTVYSESYIKIISCLDLVFEAYCTLVHFILYSVGTPLVVFHILMIAVSLLYFKTYRDFLNELEKVEKITLDGVQYTT